MLLRFLLVVVLLAQTTCGRKETATGVLQFRIVQQDQREQPSILLTTPELSNQFCYMVHVTGQNVPRPPDHGRIFEIGGADTYPQKGDHCSIDQGKLYGSFRYGDTARLVVPESSNLTVQLVGIPLSELNANGVACSGLAEWRPVVDFDEEDNLVFLNGTYLPTYRYTFYLFAEATGVSINRGEQSEVVLNLSPSMHEHPCFSEIDELYTSSTEPVNRVWINGLTSLSFKFFNINSTGIYVDALNNQSDPTNASHGLCDKDNNPATGNTVSCPASFQGSPDGGLNFGLLSSLNIFYLTEVHNDAQGMIANAVNTNAWAINSGTYKGWKQSNYPVGSVSTGQFFPDWAGKAAGHGFRDVDGKGLLWSGGKADNCQSEDGSETFSCSVIYKSWDGGVSWYRVFEGFRDAKITDAKKHSGRSNMFFVEAFSFESSGSTHNRIRILYSRD